MSTFFFYHNLKGEDKIKSLNIPCTIESGTILADNYNEKNGHLTLGSNEIVEGKLVTFNASIKEVVQELNNIKHNLSLGKTKYNISTTLVNVNNQLKDSFIII